MYIYHDMLLCTTYIYTYTHVSFTICREERKGIYTYISNSNHTMTRYYILHTTYYILHTIIYYMYIYIYTYTHVSFTIWRGKERSIYIYIYIHSYIYIYHDILLCTTYIHTHTRIFYNSTHIEIVHRWTRK